MRKIIFISVLLLAFCAGAALAQESESPKLTRAGSFVVQTTASGKFYFILKSSNGQEIFKGYQFVSEEKVREAIASVKSQAPDEANFDPRNEKAQWYFFLKDAGGKAIGRSENYTTEAAMKRGIESVMKTAPHAGIK